MGHASASRARSLAVVDVIGVTKLYGDLERVDTEVESVRDFFAEHEVSYPTLIAGPAFFLLAQASSCGEGPKH